MNQELQRHIRQAERDRLEAGLLLQIRAAGLPLPEREVRFSPPRRWRFDFCYPPPIALAIECEGGVWKEGGGRHQRGPGFEADCRKYGEAVALGYRVLRVTASMIASGEALTLLERVLGANAGLEPSGAARPQDSALTRSEAEG